MWKVCLCGSGDSKPLIGLEVTWTFKLLDQLVFAALASPRLRILVAHEVLVEISLSDTQGAKVLYHCPGLKLHS